MPSVPVYNTAGEPVGEIELSDAVFAARIKPALLRQAVVMYEANRRVGTAATKTRAMVSGGGRKPWRQKGLGRARQGSIRSPLWRKGGIVFGPQPRDYRQRMPKQMRRAALKSALSAKLRDGEITVVEGLQLEEPKTRQIAEVLERLKVRDSRPLLVLPDYDQRIYLAARNLDGVRTIVAKDLNAYEVLKHGRLVLTRDAVARIEEGLAG
ncbi:MAG TPA: 50S ribosomal protein L4 [Bacillota bacterium]